MKLELKVDLKMKALVLHSYAPLDHLELTTADAPEPAADEVLVRVRATSVNPYDWHHLLGEPRVARLMPGGMGLRRPRFPILGCDVAGQVEAVGKDVTAFRRGDDVFGLLDSGGFAEYLTAREGALVRKPSNLTYEQAAAVPMAGVTALVAVRDAGRVLPGQTVLINGAAGGVGTFAVQIARALGAKVTAVCSARKADMVRSLGADAVIDYASQDFTRGAEQYDVLVDIAGSRPFSACRRVLAPKGAFVIVGGPAGRWLQPAGHAMWTMAQRSLVSQRIVLADTVGCASKQQNVETLAALIEEGKVIPVIDRSYPFDALPAALSYQLEGHASGKVVVII
jgi:NADPH:quinone reductase-like Zn-dependent oxidoreductase